MKNKNVRSARVGFTLPELLVSSALAAVIGGGLLMALRAGQISWQTTQAHIGVSYELRRGVDFLAQELAASRDDQLSIPADNRWYDSLSFRLPVDLDGNGTVLDETGALEWATDSITYSLGGADARQMVRTEGAGFRVLANGVESLQFRRLLANPDEVEISLQVRRGFTNGFQNQGTLSTRVRLRN